MNVLILGTGGREHAIAHRLNKDPSCDNVFVAPGNPGMNRDNIDTLEIELKKFDNILKTIRENCIDLVIVGPEGLLEAGIVDFLEDNSINVVGPNKKATQLESSKAFSKEFMSKYEIPTARFMTFDNSKDAIGALKEFQEGHAVIKASSLAGGKGVVVSTSHEQAKEAILDFLDNEKCLIDTREIIIEEKLRGKELSAFALFDENGFINLGYARDYKRVFENDLGPNTGGMGTFSCDSLVDKDLVEKINKDIFQKVYKGMKSEGTSFRGILFAGLMIENGDVNVIEFNVRFGDPETQSILPRIKGDLTKVFYEQTQNKITEKLTFDPRACVHVVMCSKNYPSINGEVLDINNEINVKNNIPSTKVFFAGVKKENGKLLNSGGRVLGVTGIAEDISRARELSYKQIENVSFHNSHYRKDIALDY